MNDEKKHINPFGAINKNIQQSNVTPKYIKPDGTKVFEEDTPAGKIVYEAMPNGTLMSMTYDKNGVLIMDYARRVNYEIGHIYDELGKKVYEFNNYYDENNTFVRKNEIGYDYYDEGEMSRETIISTPGDVRIEISYDREGNQTEKVEIKGSVKTWFDVNGKPIKRQIDRGSGGIITENLD